MRSRPSLFLILLLVLLAGAAATSWRAQAGSERLVLAFYYAWFSPETWRSGKLSDLPVTPYDSDDREAMARHVDQAQGAGIDAFVLNWWGVGNRTEKNLKALLDVAAERGFHAAVDFDLNSPVMSGPASYAENLRHLHAVHAAHPAYLRFQGRPVVFFYNVTRLPASDWKSIRDAVDPNRQALWIAEGTNASYLSVFDGHHLYSITWPNRIPPGTTLAKWGNRVRRYAREHGAPRLWVATVMPGYDDRAVRPAAGFARARDGGEYYRQCWQAAIDSQADWVIVNSFNEWAEGTQVEPGLATGGLYLDLTREWSARFKAAQYPPQPAAVQGPKPAHQPTATRAAPTAVAPTPAPRPVIRTVYVAD